MVDRGLEPNILDISTIDISTFVLVANISFNPDVSYDLIKTVYLMLDDTDQQFLKRFDLTREDESRIREGLLRAGGAPSKARGSH